MLREDEFGMLWVDQHNSRDQKTVFYLLSTFLTLGWQITEVTPAERGQRESCSRDYGRFH